MANQLTRAEEQFMQVLWSLEEASVKEIIEQLPMPHPRFIIFCTMIMGNSRNFLLPLLVPYR